MPHRISHVCCHIAWRPFCYSLYILDRAAKLPALCPLCDSTARPSHLHAVTARCFRVARWTPLKVFQHIDIGLQKGVATLPSVLVQPQYGQMHKDSPLLLCGAVVVMAAVFLGVVAGLLGLPPGTPVWFAAQVHLIELPKQLLHDA